MFRYDTTFPEKSLVLVGSLTSQLNCEPESLDRTMASLKYLDSLLAVRNREEIESLLPNLIAYSGLVIKQQVNGKWWMKVAHDVKDIYEPYIVGSDGVVYNTFFNFAKTVYDGDYDISLYNAVQLELQFPNSP